MYKRHGAHKKSVLWADLLAYVYSFGKSIANLDCFPINLVLAESMAVLIHVCIFRNNI